ncbi:MAG: tripartite tricarboxylate transporter substrate binding protein [Betaproteobacteria bacterium]|nr:tripartite tricarboxylate transporter substrate binding protein [Betaproteobacteria bacterium]
MNAKTICILLASTLCSGIAAAAETPGKSPYPAKPVRVIIGTSASGGTDFTARIFGQKLSDLWGQSVVMDNRPGATGMIGMGMVAHANPDGYTLSIMNVGHLIMTAITEKPPFDPGRDLLPVSIIATTPVMLVVHPSVPARTIQEFIALAKRQPGKMSYASGGIAGVQHMSTELLMQEAKIKLLHVPYKGTGPGLIELIAGQVQLTLTSVPSLMPHVNAGRLRPLAVTGERRVSAAPNVPTFKESGLPGVFVVIWYGLLAPARTPSAIVDRIARSVAEVAAMPDVKERMTRSGAEPVGSKPSEFGPYFRSERTRWVKIAKQANIKPASSR